MQSKSTNKIWIWLATAFFIFIILIIIAADLGLGEQVFMWVTILPGRDVSAHFILIGELAMLVNMALNRRVITLAGRSILLGSALLLVLVTLEEFSQIWINTRGFSFYDLAADWLGIWLVGSRASGWLHERLNARLDTSAGLED